MQYSKEDFIKCLVASGLFYNPSNSDNETVLHNGFMEGIDVSEYVNEAYDFLVGNTPYLEDDGDFK